MNQESSLHRSVSAEELRALYDIRIKEVHHYNTLVWAFPIVFTTMIGWEYRYLHSGSGLLVIAAVFNVALWYVFHRHLQNKNRIQKALKFTENRLADLYGRDFVPDFPKEEWGLPPKATDVMWWALTLITGIFLIWALAAKFCKWNCCWTGPLVSITINCDRIWHPCWLPSGK